MNIINSQDLLMMHTTLLKIQRIKQTNMKKFLSTILFTSPLVMANTPDLKQLNEKISAVKAEKSAIEIKLKALQAKLPPNEELITHVKLGYIQTDGNANTETFALEGSLKKAWGHNSASFIFDSQYGKAEKVENKNRYFLELQYAYAFSKQLSMTYVLGYKNDKFSSYNYQAYTGPGVKYFAYSSDKQKLNFDGSILYSQDQLQSQNIIAPNKATSTYSAYKLQVTYKLQVLENLKFNQDLSYRSSFESQNNYFVLSTSSFSSKISDVFSAGISYKIDYTNEVAAGVKQRDNTLNAFLSLDY